MIVTYMELTIFMKKIRFILIVILAYNKFIWKQNYYSWATYITFVFGFTAH